eukprot:6211960-Pleurochrysis_carterae.AAC.3
MRLQIQHALSKKCSTAALRTMSMAHEHEGKLVACRPTDMLSLVMIYRKGSLRRRQTGLFRVAQLLNQPADILNTE